MGGNNAGILQGVDVFCMHFVVGGGARLTPV